MPAEIPAAEDGARAGAGRWRIARRIEDGLLAFCLAVMVLLPLLEIALRKVFGWGISGSIAFTQHFVLAVSAVGGMVAARENRLLALSTFTTFLPKRWRAATGVFSGGCGAAISLWLAVGSGQFVASSRLMGKAIAYGIPVWAFQLVLPLAFGVIALRILWHSAPSWSGRLAAAAWMGALVVLGWHPAGSAGAWAPWMLGVVGLGAILGMPIFAVLGGAALVLFWGEDAPIASLAIDHYRMVVNPSLPTIPLFTLAGYFLAEGGASRRLVRVFQALFAHVRGGPAIVTALLCAFFTTFTGASGVTILALGGLLLPVLVAARYPERQALGLLTGAGSLGLLFPPCLPPILYAIVATTAGTTITLKEVFLAGLIPGVLLVVLTGLWGIRLEPKAEGQRPAFRVREAFAAVWEAKWELLLPVVALGALFGGFATPVEAAAVTALYAYIVESVIYRDLWRGRDAIRVMTECGVLVGGVLLILGVAMGFTNYLITAQIPDQAVAWVQQTIHSRWVFLLAINLFLLAVGCLMDIYSAIIVVVPLIVPMANAFGIEPVHMAVIFLANMELGYLTPPVGMNLFLASYRFRQPIYVVARAALPMLLVLAIGVLLVTYVPVLTTWLPSVIK